MKLVYAYIDESGDPGTEGGTRWLAVACAIVKEGAKANFEQQIVEIEGLISNGRPLHFAKMNHEKKKMCYQRLMGYGGVVALSDTTKPLPKRLRGAAEHYNYVLTEVLRRVLWQAEVWEEKPKIIIDRREGRFNLEGFKNHLSNFDRDDDPYTNWDWLDLDKLSDAEPDDEPCLCLADGLAHAARTALVPNVWGDTERAYLDLCLPSLWRPAVSNSKLTKFPEPYTQPPWRKLLGHGLILLPEAETWNFIQEYPWLLEYHLRKE
jgi:hypothetical protein